MSETRGLSFRALAQPVPMLDRNLGNRVVLLIGHWVDARGREVKAEVCTFTATRNLTDLHPPPPAPSFQPFEDDGR